MKEATSSSVFRPDMDCTPTRRPESSVEAKVKGFSDGVTRLESYPPRMRLPGTFFWPGWKRVSIFYIYIKKKDISIYLCFKGGLLLN